MDGAAINQTNRGAIDVRESLIEKRNQTLDAEVLTKEACPSMMSCSFSRIGDQGGFDHSWGEGVMEEVVMPLEENPLPRMRPESTVQLYDFNELPLQGRNPEEVGREFGVKVEVLHAGEKDPWRRAYTILVSGSTRAVQTFVGKYQSSPRFKPPECLLS